MVERLSKASPCYSRDEKPKKRFTARAQANARIQRMGAEHFQAYKCLDCGGWHIATRRD